MNLLEVNNICKTYGSGETAVHKVPRMKSYLSLIPISAKVRKRQNRMTILCIIISVLLVTTIFSVAEMFIRTKSDELQN